MVSAGQSGSAGPVAQFAGGIRDQGQKAASWLESKDAQELVTDVRRYAARNPMVFLAAAAGVGFVGSRLFRGLKDAEAPAGRPFAEQPHQPTHADPRPYGQPDPYRQADPYQTAAPYRDPMTPSGPQFTTPDQPFPAEGVPGDGGLPRPGNPFGDDGVRR